MESSLSVWKREDIANVSVKNNRNKGNIPGILYSKEMKPVPIYVKEAALKAFTHTSEVKVISLAIEGATGTQNCILRDVQFDPVTNRPVHFDLLGVSESEKITIEVQLVLTGIAPGVKDGGIVQHTLRKVEIECLPKDVPAFIEVNIGSLGIGDSIHLKDLVHQNFEFLDSLDSTVVSVVPPVVEKEPEAAAEGAATEEAPAEPEVISKGKKDEDDEVEEKKK